MRRALLVGAQTFGLQGVEYDVPMMAAALDARGFTDIRPCQDDSATREGIISAYEKLIADTIADDTALVYYSGHGDYFPPLPGEPFEVTRNDRQLIVPTDFSADPNDEFRGITGVELSALLGRLTEKTNNAIVVLDCCHSALMSRDLGKLRVRQLPRNADLGYEAITAHLRRLLDAGLRIDLARSEGNPHAVRMVACGQDQGAYERPRYDGAGWYGVFTDALVTALAEASDTCVSWSTLMARVRHLVLRGTMLQRPEVEGPSYRALFDVVADDSPGFLPVTALRYDGRARLDGAQLLGVEIGDEFAVESASNERLATVRIDECAPTSASGVLEPQVELPAGARAYRTSTIARRVPVRIPVTVAPAATRSMYVRPADADEETAFEVVESTDGALTLHDRIGPLHAPRHPNSDVIRQSGTDLDRVARATLLRQIREESTTTYAASIQWGRVIGGEVRPLPLAGASVGVGELVYFTLRNAGDIPLYLSLIDIGVSYAITLLTNAASSGVRLAPGQHYSYGWNDHTARMDGRPLRWPDGLDAGAPRPETVLFLVTDGPQDVTTIQQPGVRSRKQSATVVGALLDHLLGCMSRDLDATSHILGGLHVASVEFVLNPRDTAQKAQA